MKCGSCTYWENDICYRKGIRVSSNCEGCEYFVNQYIEVDEIIPTPYKN